MATKDEKKPLGNRMHKKYQKKLTKEGEEKEPSGARNEGDAEAGVDPQEEYLNEMPNNPNEGLSKLKDSKERKQSTDE